MKSTYHSLNEIIQIATTISFAKASCKKDAADRLDNYKVMKGDSSSNTKIELSALNHFATKLRKAIDCNSYLIYLTGVQ